MSHSYGSCRDSKATGSDSCFSSYDMSDGEHLFTTLAMLFIAS